MTTPSAWKTTRSIAAIGVAALSAGLLTGLLCAQGQEVRIHVGKSEDIWYGLNVKGRLHYTIRSRDGSNTVRAFWRTWGFGLEREVGRLTGDGELDIPISLWRGVISARLRVEALDDTVMMVRENATVAHSVTFTWP